MMGPKKLSTIREEIARAAAAKGDDLLRWLEERMAVPPKQETTADGEKVVLQALRRILEEPGPGKRRRGRTK